MSDGPWVPDPDQIYSQRKKKKKDETAGLCGGTFHFVGAETNHIKSFAQIVRVLFPKSLTCASQ